MHSDLGQIDIGAAVARLIVMAGLSLISDKYQMCLIAWQVASGNFAPPHHSSSLGFPFASLLDACGVTLCTR